MAKALKCINYCPFNFLIILCFKIIMNKSKKQVTIFENICDKYHEQRKISVSEIIFVQIININSDKIFKKTTV